VNREAIFGYNALFSAKMSKSASLHWTVGLAIGLISWRLILIDAKAVRKVLQ